MDPVDYTKIKGFDGEKGMCTIGSGENAFRRTKFDTEQSANTFKTFLVSMGSNRTVVYQCKYCKMFHVGNAEVIEKFRI